MQRMRVMCAMAVDGFWCGDGSDAGGSDRAGWASG